MLAKRIIPCLDVRNGRVVKGKQFTLIEDVDDPATLAKRYSLEGADELVFYDITASNERRNIDIDFVRQVAKEINIPFSVGGGLRTVDDIRTVLNQGADKVSLNSAAIDNPDLIKTAANKFGSQCIVVSMDIALINGVYKVFKHGGRIETNLEGIAWAKEAVRLGAGELVVNSIDQDGMKTGFDIPLLKKITEVVNVPVIASGGAGCIQDFIDVAKQTTSDGYLAASVFHFNTININTLKETLKSNNIDIRIESSDINETNL
ncbi:MAG: imidazole glycerol phosphate synthase subunit HisF [Bacillota bacterium]